MKNVDMFMWYHARTVVDRKKYMARLSPMHFKGNVRVPKTVILEKTCFSKTSCVPNMHICTYQPTTCMHGANTMIA